MLQSLRKIPAAVLVTLGIVLLVFIATWMAIDRVERRSRMRNRPGWLTVEASPLAVVGQPFELRVALEDLPGPENIVCGLRWTASDRRISGGLASAGPARETRGGETLVFRVGVKDNEEMRFVAAIIYLSPTGRWQDRTRGAATELIPVRPAGSKGEVPPPRVLAISPTSTPEEEARRDPGREARGGALNGLLRPLLVLVLVAAGALCAVLAVRQDRGRAQGGPLARPAWSGLALLMLLFGFLEAFDVPGRMTEWARLASMERNVYELRRPVQGAVAVAAAAGVAYLLLYLIKAASKSRDRRWLLVAGIGVIVYLSLTLVGMLSFHPVDVLRRMSLAGVSPFHAARGAGAALSLLSASLALQSAKRTDGY